MSCRIGSSVPCYRGCGAGANEFVDAHVQQQLTNLQGRVLDLRNRPTFREVETELHTLETEMNTVVNNPDHRREFQSKNSSYHRLAGEVKATFTQLHDYLHQNSDKLKAEKKWIELGFSEEWLKADPASVHFIANTGAIYSILTLKNSPDLLDPEPLLSLENGQISVLVKEWDESEYVPIQEFQKRVRYEERDDIFIDNEGKHGWNMTQWGFVPKGRFEGFEAFAQITPEALKTVVDHGKTFWSPEQQKDRNGNERNCVIQVTANFKSRMGLPRTGWAKNAIETFNHIGIRVIDPNGKVYSFGYEMTDENNRATFKSFKTFCGSANALGAWPDFDVLRPFEDCNVTTAAISEEGFNKVKKFIEENKGCRFNSIKQNCAKHVSLACKEVDIDIPIYQDAFEYLGGALPSLSQIPVIGKPLSWVAKVVSCVARAIFKVIQFITPEIIKLPFRAVWKSCKTVAGSLLALILGANKMKPRDPTDPRNQEDVIDPARMSSFSKVFRSWKDLFNPDISRVASSKKVMDWQRAQRTNAVHHAGVGSRLCIVPPAQAV